MTKISVSFSGGRSSAAMCWIVLTSPRFSDYEKQFIFANTGQEHPATLDFVNECDNRWGLNLAWVEADINPELGKGTDYRLTSYQSATRNHQLFEDGCKKYGLPNTVFKWCTRELKLVPMNKYRQATGFGDSLVSIGIRADEIDRLSSNPQIIYPLAEIGWTKQTVNAFWEKQDFNLKIPNDAYGNCVWCYKKSFRKLATIARSHPEFFDAPKYLEKKYSLHGARNESHDPKRFIYRQHRTTEYIFALSQDPFLVEYTEPGRQLDLLDLLRLNELDIGGECDQGCEVF